MKKRIKQYEDSAKISTICLAALFFLALLYMVNSCIDCNEKIKNLNQNIDNEIVITKN